MIDKKILYNIRMRASLRERHVSGAERIVSHDRIDATVRELFERARDREREPARIVVSVDALDSASIGYLTSLAVTTLEAHDHRSGRTYAARVLKLAGVSDQAIAVALKLISTGAAPSGANMRGAMIMDAETGERLEPDQERGVRASRFDWTEEALQSATRQLTALGLTHHRTTEALALATKVAHAPGIVAELCWSDEPDYIAGYVAAPGLGYVRFPFLKQKDDRHGGRAFFVGHEQPDLDALILYLEKTSVLINRVGICSASMDPELFIHKGIHAHV